MTTDDFRKLALSFLGAVESSHMQHPDFRAGGKVFASIAKPEQSLATVRLTPEQQGSFLQADEAFRPCSGAWGKRGYTHIELGKAKKSLVKAALELAFEGATAK